MNSLEIHQYNNTNNLTNRCPLCQARDVELVFVPRFNDLVCKDCKTNVIDYHREMLATFMEENPGATPQMIEAHLKSQIKKPKGYDKPFTSYLMFLMGKEPLGLGPRVAIQQEERSKLVEDLEALEEARHGRGR